jgi:PHD/YefM family antitoxin component YafN of YafNO toxin-antitoxin module
MLEGYFQERETAKLNQIVIQNYDELYEGRYTVKEEINRNLGGYLSQSLKYNMGIRMHILVRTRDDRILYPAQFERNIEDSTEAIDFSELPTKEINYMEVAAENYRILNEGLILSVGVKIKHNSWISNSILIFYVFLSLLILQKFIKKGLRETERAEKEREKVIQRLSGQLTQTQEKLKEVAAKEADYGKKISHLNKEKNELSTDIDGMFDEMEKLEVGLGEQRNLKEEMEFEVLQLREELDRLKGKPQKPKKKKKKSDAAGKRFRVLYKNLDFTDRAIEGFLSLSDEFQLKAEEVIHKVNEDETQVAIKRKVFGKGGKMNILEVDFSYSGRLYFQKDFQSKTKIVAIGTKNTQNQDLAFIEKVK